MKSEAFTEGVLQSAFNNFAQFTVNHLCWSLFLINLQAWWCTIFSRKRTLAQVFSFTFSEIFKKTLSEMNQKNCIHKIYLQGNTGDGVLFSAIPDMWAYSFSKTGLHQRCFSMKIGKFYTTSVLQNNAERLFLISCDNFNVLHALSLINQFSHNMEI